MTTSNDKPVPFITIWAEGRPELLTIPELEIDRKKLDDNGKALHPARATMEVGFPDITMKSAMQGGVPPWGQDHNKILNQITEAIRWMQAGGCAFFNKALCDKIKGYPQRAILQGKKCAKNDKNEDVPLLWFSIMDGNMTDPDAEDSSGWVKLDFADLEKRLKKAEDDINYINYGKNDGNFYINTFPYVNYMFKQKADLEGSCNIDFHAKIMRASEYRFCNESFDGKGYITQKNKSIDIYSDKSISFRFPEANNNLKNEPNVPADSALTLDVGYDETTKAYITTSYFPATNSIFNGGFVNVKSVLSIQNNLLQFTVSDNNVSDNKKKSLTWQTEIDCNFEDFSGTKDYIIKVFGEKEDTFREVLRLSYEDYNIYAPSGAFVNGPKGDLAEYYQADAQNYMPGTLMCHGSISEVTLCKNSNQADDFFGIISTDPAYIMNGNAEKNPNYVLIALNGKVPVKVKGIVKCGDKITVGQDGYGVVSTNKNDVIVGRAKEDKITEEVGLVSCYVQARL